MRGSENPLERSLGHVVDLPGLSSLSFLSEELPHRLEKVHEKALISVNLVQKFLVFGGGVPLIPHELAHRRPVLLLHISLVVFLVRPTPGEGDPLLLAVPKKVRVDEGAVIVRVDPQKREQKAAADPVHRLLHRLLASVGKDPELTPALGHIHGTQGVEVFPLSALPAVGHKVHLQESWAAVIPVGEGSDRNLLSE